MSPRAHRVNPGRVGLPHALPAATPVVVVGGGLAGLAAATVLAERGARVTVIEREAFLGGRAGAWTERLADGAPFEMERGFHAFFRHYYNLRALLRRIDPDLGMLIPLEDYPLFGPDGLRESFSGLPRTPPWNLLALIRRSPTLRLRDALRVDDTLGQAMMAYDAEATLARYDHVSAKEYLDRLGFPPKARQMLFDVFAPRPSALATAPTAPASSPPSLASSSPGTSSTPPSPPPSWSAPPPPASSPPTPSSAAAAAPRSRSGASARAASSPAGSTAGPPPLRSLDRDLAPPSRRAAGRDDPRRSGSSSPARETSATLRRARCPENLVMQTTNRGVHCRCNDPSSRPSCGRGLGRY